MTKADKTAERFSPALKGVAAMILASLLLTMNDAISKYLTETLPVGQVIALRQTFSLLVIVPYIHWVTGWEATEMTRKGGVSFRAFCFVASTGLIVLSLSLLPLALVTAIVFASPIFVVAFSHFLLSENVGPRRWLAVLAGFGGVLIIVRPGGASFEWVLVVPVIAAMASGLGDTVTRALSKTESSIGILYWSTLAVIAAACLTAPFGWQALTLPAAGWLLINGIVGGTAHFFMIDALRLGDASLVSPFRFTGLIWAAILGLLVWGQFPDGWTILGAGVLIASGIYIIEREPKKKREQGS
jgi:drug/metabolite transporter (DMT)-like permease